MTETQGRDAAAVLESAGRLADAGRFDDAEAELHNLLQGQAQHPRAWLQLFDTQWAADRPRAARHTALTMCAMQPYGASFLVALMWRLRMVGEAQAILDCCDRLPPVREMPPDQLIAAASLLKKLDQYQRALDFLDGAPRMLAKTAAVRMIRGEVLGALGRAEEARATLEAGIARGGEEISQAWWLLARLQTATPADNHVAALQQELGRAGSPLDKTRLAFALHKELDDLGDHDRAWAALEQACAGHRASLSYDNSDMVELVDRLLAWRAPGHGGAAAPGAVTPIFIVGMHRSGTTLMERILGGHPVIADAGELDDFADQVRMAADHRSEHALDAATVARVADIDFPQLGQSHLERTAWRTGGKAYFTDKAPANFLHAGFIASALPQARIIHMTRNPLDTCLSNLRELYGKVCPYSYDQAELADYYLQYRRLMAHWHEAFPGRILDVCYEQLVGDPEAEVRKVLDFCGLDFQPDMLAIENRDTPVNTASAAQVRQPIHGGRIGRWRRYEKQLQPLRERLADIL